MGIFGFGDIVLLIFVILVNYFWISMYKILYGTFFVWHFWPRQVAEDFKRLKLLASQADSLEVRQRCKFILSGIYFSVGFLILGCIVGVFI